jgi:hypothetical protein
MADKKVFLSYSSDDQVFVDELRKAMMSENDVQVWDPAYAVEPGTKTEEVINAELNTSDIFVYIIPEKEGAGKWSLLELGAAKALGKRIVAVLPDSTHVANSAVAASLADSLIVNRDRKSAKETARKILEKAA